MGTLPTFDVVFKEFNKCNERTKGEFMENENKNLDVILTRVGTDFWDMPVYEVGDTKTYVKDIELGEKDVPTLYWSSPKYDVDGEPDYAFKLKEGKTFMIIDSTKKKFESDLPEYIPSEEQLNAQEYLKKFNLNSKDEYKYMMLGRMKRDCEYYLGFGNQNTEVLWAKEEHEQIDIMKNLFESFPDDKKPKWISLEDITTYENQMISSCKEIDNEKIVLNRFEPNGVMSEMEIPSIEKEMEL